MEKSLRKVERARRHRQAEDALLAARSSAILPTFVFAESNFCYLFVRRAS